MCLRSGSRSFKSAQIMSWIKIIEYSEAQGALKQLYQRIAGSRGQLDNILKVHSLRPHTLQGHMTLYKNVLHHSGNTVPKSFLETIGIFVSALNGCAYCVEHHTAGLRKLLDDPEEVEEIKIALVDNKPEKKFQGKNLEALKYARKLTREPQEIQKPDYDRMIEMGFDEGEVLEINQVVAYFAYANRTVNGLGVQTDGEVLGLSPANQSNADDWGHR
jgi:uncharacterized peroxidase-related enzyme